MAGPCSLDSEQGIGQMALDHGCEVVIKADSRGERVRVPTSPGRHATVHTAPRRAEASASASANGEGVLRSSELHALALSVMGYPAHVPRRSSREFVRAERSIAAARDTSAVVVVGKFRPGGGGPRKLSDIEDGAMWSVLGCSIVTKKVYFFDTQSFGWYRVDMGLKVTPKRGDQRLCRLPFEPNLRSACRVAAIVSPSVENLVPSGKPAASLCRVIRTLAPRTVVSS